MLLADTKNLKMNNLKEKKLTLLSITRQKIIDAQVVCSCDNCNKTIVNIAKVQDTKNNIFHIGLDCKATLFGETKDKEKRKLRRHTENVLKYFFKPRYTVTVCNSSYTITVVDEEKDCEFGFGKGRIVYTENVGYLLNKLNITVRNIIDAVNFSYKNKTLKN